MLIKTEAGYYCPECGREYDNDKDLAVDGPCPSDDCPSNTTPADKE